MHIPGYFRSTRIFWDGLNLTGIPLRLGVLLSLCLIISRNGISGELWVDRNSLGGTCDNTRPRSSVTKATPWCTLNAIRDDLLPGDVVYVRAGVYSELFGGCDRCWNLAVLQAIESGTAENPIRFSAYNGETVVLSGSGGATFGILAHEDDADAPHYVEFSGFTVRDAGEFCVLVSGTSNIVLSDLEVTECRGQAVGVHRSSRITVENSKIHHNPLGGWTSAVNFWLCEDGGIIRGNEIWANTDEDPRETEGHGIILDGCSPGGTTLIENNVIWNNEGWCINIHFSDGAIIRNNTCWENGWFRPGSGELSVAGAYASIHNNILVSRDGAVALQIVGLSGSPDPYETIRSDHNLLWSPYHENVARWPIYSTGTVAEYQAANGYGWGSRSIQLDPSFLDSTTGNFAIDRTSPTLDWGLTREAAPFDARGFRRPLDSDGDGISNADLGPYEYAGVFTDGFESGNSVKWAFSSP